MTARAGADMRERILLAAREQLRDVANEALASALDALETRVVQRRAGGGSRVRPGGQLERMREVLERDRALASACLPDDASPAPAAAPIATPAAAAPLPAAAALPAPAPVPVPAAATAAPAPAAACDEPIRTRSMAKLLAAQGHLDRALAIYAHLLAQDGGNAALQAEAETLREAQRVAAAQHAG